MISVVVPNYNGLEILKKTLQHNIDVLEGLSYEYIIVDDGSSDESISFLETNYPQVNLVKNIRNIGFSRSCNAGVNAATKDIVLLLNNDMLIHELNLPKIIDYLQDDSIFSVTPKIEREHAEKGIVNESITKGWFISGYIRTCNIAIHAPEYKPKEKEPILWSCGGGMFFKRDKFEELGGLDGDVFYPFYFEDVDLSYRAWLKGWGNYYSEFARFEHFHQQTISTFSQSYIKRISKRNAYLLLWKNIRDPKMIVSHIISLIVRVLTLQIRELYIICSGLAMLPTTFNKSRQIDRVRSDVEIFDLFEKSKEYLKN